jgi:hypothetical protein
MPITVAQKMAALKAMGDMEHGRVRRRCRNAYRTAEFMAKMAKHAADGEVYPTDPIDIDLGPHWPDQMRHRLTRLVIERIRRGDHLPTLWEASGKVQSKILLRWRLDARRMPCGPWRRKEAWFQHYHKVLLSGAKGFRMPIRWCREEERAALLAARERKLCDTRYEPARPSD